MSASDAPANPGAPKPPRGGAGLFARHGTKMIAGAAILGAGYAYMAFRPPAPVGTRAVNPIRTPGVKNIEGAYKSGGATATHTKAYGGTKQGDRSDETLREGGGTGNEKGFDHPDMGDAQRWNDPSAPTKKFKEMQYGNSESK